MFATIAITEVARHRIARIVFRAHRTAYRLSGKLVRLAQDAEETIDRHVAWPLERLAKRIHPNGDRADAFYKDLPF